MYRNTSSECKRGFLHQIRSPKPSPTALRITANKKRGVRTSVLLFQFIVLKNKAYPPYYENFIIFFVCYFRSLPLDVWKYAFGAWTKISHQNPLTQTSPVALWITANKKGRCRLLCTFLYIYICGQSRTPVPTGEKICGQSRTPVPTLLNNQKYKKEGTVLPCLLLCFLLIKLVVEPPQRVFVYVSQMFFVVFAVTDDMVVKARLPNVFSVFFIAKTFQGRYKLRNSAICGGGATICRDRRPRLSVWDRHPRLSVPL